MGLGDFTRCCSLVDRRVLYLAPATLSVMSGVVTGGDITEALHLHGGDWARQVMDGCSRAAMVPC